MKWGQEHGTDIEARKGDCRWIIEAKGQGSRNEMRVNYFLCILGETLQRMTDAEAKYSIALPHEMAVSDPSLFLQRFEPPVIIDEIQYAPSLHPHIKMRVDKQRRSGDFWLTGSQVFHLMRGVSESLAGRVGIVNLPGLSNSEISGQVSAPFTGRSADLLAKSRTAKSLGLNGL